MLRRDAAAHIDTYPARKSEYGPDLAELIEQGIATKGTEIAGIKLERMRFSRELSEFFEAVDILLISDHARSNAEPGPDEGYGEDPNVLLGILRFTAPFDFSGSPTLTLPNGLNSAGMPLSMQLVGPHLSEDVLIRAGHAFQRVTNWHERRPPIA